MSNDKPLEADPTSVRRLAGVIITGEAIAEFVREGQRTVHVCSGVPATASFFTSYFDHSRNAFVAVFEDDSFGLVSAGCKITMLYIPHLTITPLDEDFQPLCP